MLERRYLASQETIQIFAFTTLSPASDTESTQDIIVDSPVNEAKHRRALAESGKGTMLLQPFNGPKTQS